MNVPRRSLSATSTSRSCPRLTIHSRRETWLRWAARGVLCVVAGWVAVSTQLAEACSTPVYRYAMYNWAPAPYYVFYFHHGQPADADEEVNQLITDLAETGPKFANLLLVNVDLSQDGLDRMPQPVKEAWEAHAAEQGESPQPAHLVFTSWGAKLFVGRLDKATLTAMVESPVRTGIGEQLQEGCSSVAVLLPGSDAAENERAEKAAKEVISQAAAGEIPVDSGFPVADLAYLADSDENAEDALDEEEAIRAANRLQIGFVKISRSDAKEDWLVRSLMAMEPDLYELVDQPMVFFTYGRGRAMPPYVGKGITTDHLTGEIQFLAGACSCMVKEQNPGEDLLMCWDWDAAADALAATDPAFGGGPYAYQEFSPDDAGSVAASVNPETEAGPASAVASVPSPGGETPSDGQGGDLGAASGSTASGSDPAAEAPGQSSQTATVGKTAGAVSPITVETPAGSSTRSFATRQSWTIGLGLALAAVVVLSTGFALIRRRAASGGHSVP